MFTDSIRHAVRSTGNIRETAEELGLSKEETEALLADVPHSIYDELKKDDAVRIVKTNST